MLDFLGQTWLIIATILGFVANVLSIYQLTRPPGSLARWLRKLHILQVFHVLLRRRSSSMQESLGQIPEVAPRHKKRQIAWGTIAILSSLLFISLSVYLHSSLLDVRFQLHKTVEVYGLSSPDYQLYVRSRIRALRYLEARSDSMVSCVTNSRSDLDSLAQSAYCSNDSMNALLLQESVLERGIKSQLAIIAWYRETTEGLYEARDMLARARDSATEALSALDEITDSLARLKDDMYTQIVPPLISATLLAPDHMLTLTYRLPHPYLTVRWTKMMVNVPLGTHYEIMHSIRRAPIEMTWDKLTNNLVPVDTLKLVKSDVAHLVAAQLTLTQDFAMSLSRYKTWLDSLSALYRADLNDVSDSLRIHELRILLLNSRAKSCAQVYDSVDGEFQYAADAYQNAVESYNEVISDYEIKYRTYWELLNDVSRMIIKYRKIGAGGENR